MTLKQAKQSISDNKCTLTIINGEYRVNIKGGKEASAYYTNCLIDAYQTSALMRKYN
jgi:hypothetical protein